MSSEQSNGAITQVQASPAPVRRNRVEALLKSDQAKNAIAQALPQFITPERFTRIALLALTKQPKLKECDEISFYNAILTLASLGLEPDGRRAHLIPFENRRAGIIECQAMIDYKGFVDLAYRTNKVASIHADIVCENDDFEWDTGRVTRHRIDFRADRGKAYGVYAIVTFKDGGTKSEFMARDEVYAIRDRSQAYRTAMKCNRSDTPWITDEFEMWKKTAMKRLAKWIPLSSEQRDAVEADDADFERLPDAAPPRPALSGRLGTTPSRLIAPPDEAEGDDQTQIDADRQAQDAAADATGRGEPDEMTSTRDEVEPPARPVAEEPMTVDRFETLMLEAAIDHGLSESELRKLLGTIKLRDGKAYRATPAGAKQRRALLEAFREGLLDLETGAIREAATAE